MAQYILRDVDDELWKMFTERAKINGWPLRPLFLQLISEYATDTIQLKVSAPMSEYDWMRPYFRSLAAKDPNFLAAPIPMKWLSLESHAKASGGLDSAKLQVFELTDRSRRGPILDWLQNSIVQMVTTRLLGEPRPEPRTIAVKLMNPDRVIRIDGVEEVEEQQRHLVLFGPDRQALSRLAWNDVVSWYPEQT